MTPNQPVESAVRDHAELKGLLEQHQQQHLLRFWNELDHAERMSLANQIHSVDFELIRELFEARDVGETWEQLASRAEVPPAITCDDFHDEVSYQRAYQRGAEAIAEGKVAMILTAGGQGSRLGFDHPKGMFPIGPVSNRTLYQMIIEKVLARGQQFGSAIPFFVMSSPPTHQESSRFLEQNQYFGYAEDDFRIFCQGVMPAVDQAGKLILGSKSSLFLSPDGHGGMLGALDRTGCLNEMLDRGIEHVFYGQVDNPLIQACDPALIGYHILADSEMTSQVVRKSSPLQRVGNVVSIDGKVQIIEYSDLPEQYARQTDDDGSLKLWAGSIAVHVFETSFLKTSASKAGALPFHRANKVVPFVDENGQRVQPDRPNAVKFERFIFDLLPWARNAIVCEVDPAEGFCAVKNAAPANAETPEHVRAAISELHRRWLLDAGVSVGQQSVVEISPFFAVEPSQLLKKLDRLPEIGLQTFIH